jgi:radical SAM superfamily enzyme YgiQ (UPF0313 family)
MSNQVTYLSPGFLVTLGERRQKYHFSQFPGALRRVSPARLALVDALNKGFEGDLEDLLAAIEKRLNGSRSAMREFIKALDSAGYITHSVPPIRYVNEPSGALGVAGNGEVTIATPTSLVTQSGHYLWFDHEGSLLLRLTLPELIAAAMFSQATTVAAARQQYLAQDNVEKIDTDAFDDLVSRMAGAGIFSPEYAKEDNGETELFGTVDRATLQALIDTRIAIHDARVIDEGKNLIQVVPVNTIPGTTPASLGIVMAYAMEYQGGQLQEKYDFVPMFLTDEPRIVERASTPGIFIFSNYLWNVEENLALSAAVKAANPLNITIHGGPSTPSYERDNETFFAEYSHIDITVRGEGELTFADILDKLDPHQPIDLTVLKAVPGISFRTLDGVCRTENRERIADIDTIPSPYLTGLFDEFGSVRSSAIIETNRGCPYGCTFCDWGSATLSKVRKFDLERVFAELEWSAKHNIEDASIADANFGMLERDVAITQKIADLRKVYGHPNTVGINYAKNQVKYLRDIIKIMADAGILTEGKISLQSMDESTLKVIDRSNIKLTKYNELATEFRRARLPLGIELMMGLPGATPLAFRNDLQECTNRDVRVQINPTLVLPNSPMNDPDYREKHGIVAKVGEYVKECSTYSRKEWEEMWRLRSVYLLLDTYGTLRYVARYIRSETGMHEIEFYDRLQMEVLQHPREWPVIADTLRSLDSYMAPPGSWSFFIEEVRRYVIDHMGLPDSSGFRTTLAVQHAHLPAADRKFPYTLNLEHDFTAWWNAMLVSREEGHREDWEKHVPSLSEFGPAKITVADPNKICSREVGKSLGALSYNLRTWELDSPVARARALMAARAM